MRGTVQPYLYYACLRLSQVIQQCFDLEDKHTGYIQTQCLEFFLADYYLQYSTISRFE